MRGFILMIYRREEVILDFWLVKVLSSEMHFGKSSSAD